MKSCMYGFFGKKKEYSVLECTEKIFFLCQTMYFHGARFSNYEAWLSDPVHIKPSAQVVWPVVGQEILNGDFWFLPIMESKRNYK
jgi:hypothetical protein